MYFSIKRVSNQLIPFRDDCCDCVNRVPLIPECDVCGNQQPFSLFRRVPLLIMNSISDSCLLFFLLLHSFLFPVPESSSQTSA